MLFLQNYKRRKLNSTISALCDHASPNRFGPRVPGTNSIAKINAPAINNPAIRGMAIINGTRGLNAKDIKTKMHSATTRGGNSDNQPRKLRSWSLRIVRMKKRKRQKMFTTSISTSKTRTELIIPIKHPNRNKYSA